MRLTRTINETARDACGRGTYAHATTTARHRRRRVHDAGRSGDATGDPRSDVPPVIPGAFHGLSAGRAAAAEGAGLDEEALGALLTSVAEDPDGAFEELRELLFDASLALLACADADAAIAALGALSSNRFSCLLHHYEVSNWVLYARAYAGPAVADDPALVMDRAVRAAPVALDWLEANWLTG